MRIQCLNGQTRTQTRENGARRGSIVQSGGHQTAPARAVLQDKCSEYVERPKATDAVARTNFWSGKALK